MTIFVTGVPGVGKTTTASAIAKVEPQRFVHISFGSLISQALGGSVQEFSLRQQPTLYVTKTVIDEATTLLIAQIKRAEAERLEVIVDSHAVSQDSFGYVVTPDGHSYFSQISYRAVFQLSATPEAVLSRSNPTVTGRQAKSPKDVEKHENLQNAVSVLYASMCDCPLYVVDANRPQAIVVSDVVQLIGRLDSSRS